jgi:hypothetical protein
VGIGFSINSVPLTSAASESSKLLAHFMDDHLFSDWNSMDEFDWNSSLANIVYYINWNSLTEILI